MDEVKARGESILITKRGEPVARLVPFKDDVEPNRESGSIFGFMRGHGVAVGDIVGPILPQDEWEHLKEDSEIRPPK